MRKILIVGAGPAGIFTALELVRNGVQDDITIIEQGRLIENRVCPKNKTKDCIHCKPYCNITSGFSGAGAFSDGKLSLNREVGGDFPSLVGEDVAQDKFYLYNQYILEQRPLQQDLENHLQPHDLKKVCHPKKHLLH